jgi:hypothetical protein
MVRKLVFTTLIIAILGSGILFVPGLAIRTVLAGRGEVDDSTRQQMLAATVQIVLLAPVVDEAGQPVITNNGGDLQMQYQVGEGLGTLVNTGNELVIVTHDHWSLLGAGLAKARFYSADNVLLTEVSASEFLGLIRSRDGGTLVLNAPAALLASGLVPAALGDSDTAGWGDLVAVVYRQPGTGELSVKQMAVTSVEDYQTRPSYALQSAEGTVVVPGNSGGGVWQDGRLVGNMWTTTVFENQGDGTTRTTSQSRAAQLTANW